MNLAALLELIFEEPMGIEIFDQDDENNDNDNDFTVSSFDKVDLGIALMQNPCASLTIDEQTFAVASWGKNSDATVMLQNAEGKVLSVWVLEDPINEDDITDDTLLTELPISWKTVEGTGTLYGMGDVYGLVSNDDTVEPTTVEVEDDASDQGTEQAPVEDGTTTAPEPSLINDAQVIGDAAHPDMQKMLAQNVTFMTGNLYDQGDRRNTQSGGWQKNAQSWLSLMAAEWSPFTVHKESKGKQGESIVVGETIEGNRNAESVKSIGAVVIDIDSGPTYESVRDRLEELGQFAIMYTSFNNKKTEIVLKHDDVVRKLKLDDTPNRLQVLEYLTSHHKDRYDEDFLQGIEIKDARQHGPKGLQIVLTTPPLHKFRVVLPLWEPVELSSLGTTASQWKDAWADIVTGYCVNTLGISFDSTSCDVNRLFYTARHPKDGDWESTVIQGRALRADEVETYSKNAYIKNREPFDPFTMAGTGGADDDRPPQCLAPSGMVLNAWHTRAKERFLIDEVIMAEAPDKVRREASDGKIEIECPFEHEHSTEGGTGTLAMSPHVNEHGVWSLSCPHDACQGRHKLAHLEEMLKAGWFDEECLTSEDYLIPSDEDDEEEKAEKARADAPKDSEGVTRTPIEMANDLPDNIADDKVLAFMKRIRRMNVDQSVRNVITDILMKKTALTKGNLNSMWRGLERDATAEKKASAADDLTNFKGVPIVNQWDHDTQVEYARMRIHDENTKHPFLFHYMDEMARIEQDGDGVPKVRMLSQDQFGAELNAMTKWNTISFAGETQVERGVPAPIEVVKQLFNSRRHALPPLRGMVTSPIFTKKGEMLTTAGYHASSGLYYEPNLSVDIPKVSMKPTQDEVDDALELLVDTIADFPLGGLTRKEIMAQAFSEEGIPAVTHCLSMVLLLFAREMVAGSTPGHLLTKPAPGTGASLLNDVCSIIATGQPTPAVAMPRNPEEMSKTLITFMADGSPIIYFDNISAGVDSGELASAMTAPKYKARMLGKSQTVEAEVRCVWVFTGNNVQLSSELLRRLVMIDLNARMAHPEMRTKFKHKDIVTWSKENRGQLVHACLTIIQNWIAQGKPEYHGPVLNSFENWSRVMGGIMTTAGLNGFLGNRDELKDIASDDADDDIVPLLDTWWDLHPDDKVVVKLNKDIPSLMEVALENDIQLPIRMKVTVDGDRTLNGRAFGKLLSQHRGRVFVLTSGEEVMIEKLATRHKHGTLWTLGLAGGEED